MRTTLSIVAMAVLTTLSHASFAAAPNEVRVCTAQGAPPHGLPICVWSLPATSGEVLHDTAGSASASEVRRAISVRRKPKLSPHAVTDAEGALAANAVRHSTIEFSGVLGNALPRYAPVTVMSGKFESGFDGIHMAIHVHDSGGITFVYEFPTAAACSTTASTVGAH
ncbi:hypothetical protein [Myxococcus xanthus]|uniref:hypothetical protein n=2 Tax=Myxococcus xanthus TaxID=34 RepID=UPI00089BF3D8|nr:hypothetical protein [Myxococcus xanthus]QZZ49865.1 hypothetical protein MyxoNM_11725 [Myxococcus xanthus]UYI16816.1 hypothetical protein N3T43_11060 [Myxococcus xanthus]UYI24283.1 hypothetical protein N1129_11600 [Myxococcus xanthus]SDY23102.1 hypothetical protein SAMN05444383_12611 [Myxococcus xanthus]